MDIDTHLTLVSSFRLSDAFVTHIRTLGTIPTDDLVRVLRHFGLQSVAEPDPAGERDLVELTASLFRPEMRALFDSSLPLDPLFIVDEDFFDYGAFFAPIDSPSTYNSDDEEAESRHSQTRKEAGPPLHLRVARKCYVSFYKGRGVETVTLRDLVMTNVMKMANKVATCLRSAMQAVGVPVIFEQDGDVSCESLIDDMELDIHCKCE